jgi:PAS domain S-box-containing protein
MSRKVGAFDLADILPVGICAIQKNSIVTFWNRRLEEWTGLPREAVLGKTISTHFPNLGTPRYTTRIEQVFKDRLPVFFSPQMHPHIIPVHCSDDSLRFQRTSIVPVTHDGNVIHAVIVIEDITEAVSQVYSYRAMRDQALADLEERRRAERIAREANRKLGLLNSITRHDIKNQLTAILAYGELLEEETSDPSHKHFLTAILQAARTIDRQISYTKEYQEIGAHEPVWIRLDTMIQKAARLIKDRNLTIECETGATEVYADPLTEKVFQNLVENTIQHGQKASRIHFSTQRTDNGIALVCEDDGIGIPEPEKNRIFSRGYGPNSGFGLSLAREILSLTGIEMVEDGVPGIGARFRFLIPEGAYRPPLGVHPEPGPG